MSAPAPTSGRRKRYPEYRASGIAWIGDIPSVWADAPLYSRYDVALGKMLNERAISGDHLAPYLRNTDVQWDRVRTENLPEMDFPPQQRERYRLRDGDLLVCEGGEIGRTAVWRGEVAECFYQKAVHRVRPKSADETPRFLYYLMVAGAAIGAFRAGANTSTIGHLTAVKLKRHRFPFPPHQDQVSIAAFLDAKTAEIDALIAKKERLIATLAEQRSARIALAISKGVDHDVTLKESGVYWLGRIPAHWEVIRTKFVARLRSGHTPSRQHPEYWENCTIPWFGLADVWQLRDGRVEYVSETAEEISELGLANSAARLLPKGTVILSRTASVGFSAILGADMATTQDFVNWVCGPRIRPEFLLYVFRAMAPEFKRLVMGSTHQTIYMPDAGKFVCPVPPLEEQDRIITRIHADLGAIDALTDRVRLAIDRLREYRTALISAAVTGKIDVRSYQATPCQ